MTNKSENANPSFVPPTPWLNRNFFTAFAHLNNYELADKFGGNESTWRRARKAHGLPKADVLSGPMATWDDDTERELYAVEEVEEAETVEYKETHEILENGSQRSDKLVYMNAEESKSPEFLLKAHGFDPALWDLVSAKNNIWNVFSKDLDGSHNVSTLYSSKITVKPVEEKTDWDAILAKIATVNAVFIEDDDAHYPGVGLLEVNNTDMHIGNSTLEWYRPQLARTLNHIRSRRWAEIVIPIGSDLFHCDNFKNTTSNGTVLSSVDWPSALADGTLYYSTLIEEALKYADSVYCYYVIGNHDESMAWMFCNILAAKYPQVHFNLEIQERKVHRFHGIAIGMTHGDCRTRKDLDRIFMAEFPEFASATIREVHAGHYHHEVTRDEYGVVVRSLSTAARTDKWSREEGYVGAMKRFTLFEYEPDMLSGIHYV